MSDPNHKWWHMRAKDVFQEDELLKQYTKNQSDRLRRLKTTIRLNMDKIAFDDAAVEEHLRNYPPPTINNRGNLRLHGHPAKKFLELDVAAGKHLTMKPKELRETREEYKEFTNNKQWSKLVNKEVEKQRKEGFWADKRNREGQKRHAKRREEQLRAVDL